MERVARVYEQQQQQQLPSVSSSSQPAANHHHNHNQHHQHQHQHHHHHHHICSQLTAQNKRKEKARIAARARRSQEASIIMEMANELHITQEKMRRIDKATIVKLAIDYIKAFEYLCRYNNPQALSSHGNYIKQQQQQQPKLQPQQDQENHIQSQQQHQQQVPRRQLGDQQQQQPSIALGAQPATYPMPKLSTTSIFAPKTKDMNTHFLVIDECNGKSSLILKPDTEVLDEDDLTHLAPQAGDISIPLEVEPLDDIVLDSHSFF